MNRGNTNWWQDAFNASFSSLTWEEQRDGKENRDTLKYSEREQNLYVLNKRLSKITSDHEK